MAEVLGVVKDPIKPGEIGRISRGFRANQWNGQLSQGVSKTQLVHYVWILVADIRDNQIGLTNCLAGALGPFFRSIHFIVLPDHSVPGLFHRAPDRIDYVLTVRTKGGNHEYRWFHRLQFTASLAATRPSAPATL